MEKQPIRISEEEYAGIKSLIDSGDMESAKKQMSELASQYGLPALPGVSYGLTTSRRIVEPPSIRPISNSQAFAEFRMSPVASWILGGQAPIKPQ